MKKDWGEFNWIGREFECGTNVNQTSEWSCDEESILPQTGRAIYEFNKKFILKPLDLDVQFKVEINFGDGETLWHLTGRRFKTRLWTNSSQGADKRRPAPSIRPSRAWFIFPRLSIFIRLRRRLKANIF